MTQSDPVMPDFQSIPDGDLVLYCECPISKEGLAMLEEYFQKELPGRKVLILDNRLRLESFDSNKRLDSIESKLDQLINQQVITGSPI